MLTGAGIRADCRVIDPRKQLGERDGLSAGGYENLKKYHGVA